MSTQYAIRYRTLFFTHAEQRVRVQPVCSGEGRGRTRTPWRQFPIPLFSSRNRTLCRCLDRSRCFFFASNISYAFTLHLSKEMDASRFFGARKCFAGAKISTLKNSTLEKSSSKTFNVEKFIVEKKYRRKFQRWRKSTLKKVNVEKSQRWKKSTLES